MTGRTVRSWRWVFGDGHHVATTTGTVSHTYTATPAAARNYAVSLVVSDSQGAVGSAATSEITGTAIELAPVVKTTHTLRVPGRAGPFLGGKPVTVVLQRRTGGTFHALATKHLTFNGSSSFSAVFDRPATGLCRAVATFAGDATHLAGRQTKTFSC